ncbi:hypothetical protein HF325_001478 [Metschnikowia pulcherrima]|uniref:Uncharacterized protein n=1 Tax=Metschnikowia pulcherrima TaxID=27326 RepID=A0A8H7GVU1_9ASCO|nr:hypothetical protein HF325_001478 [Metschnikowia pulcherrima]
METLRATKTLGIGHITYPILMTRTRPRDISILTTNLIRSKFQIWLAILPLNSGLFRQPTPVYNYLNQGESPLAILKYLLLFTCTHSRPEKGELIHVLSVLKAVQKSGIGGEHLLYNVIERLAGTDCYEPQLLRTRMITAE